VELIIVMEVVVVDCLKERRVVLKGLVRLGVNLLNYQSLTLGYISLG
jgi:hypothetical protein